MPKQGRFPAQPTLLALLHVRAKRTDPWVRASEITNACSVTPNAVHQAACRLRKAGHKLTTSRYPTLRYRLLPSATYTAVKEPRT